MVVWPDDTHQQTRVMLIEREREARQQINPTMHAYIILDFF